MRRGKDHLKLKFYLFLALGLLFQNLIESTAIAASVKIEGLLREKGTRKALPQVNVYLFPESSPTIPIKTTTNLEGKFRKSHEVCGAREGAIYAWMFG